MTSGLFVQGGWTNIGNSLKKFHILEKQSEHNAAKNGRSLDMVVASAAQPSGSRLSPLSKFKSNWRRTCDCAALV